MRHVLTRPDTALDAAAVSFENLGKSFPSRDGRYEQPVLTDVSFRVEPGEIVTVLGPSGCGKSTLLRAVGGLSAPTSGAVRIDDDVVSGIDPRCAVGFQEPRLLPWRTITKNVEIGLPARTPSGTGRRRVAELLDLVGLTHHAGHRPGEVSGGMAQRASLARALARNPRVLLLDEPFGALDALTRIRMQDLLLQVHRADPTTVLMVTHDVEEALVLSDRVVVLTRETPTSPATVAEVLAPDLARPRSRDDTRLTAMRTHLLRLLGVER